MTNHSLNVTADAPDAVRALAEEIDQAMQRYLNALADPDQSRAGARCSLEEVLWDNKAGILAALRRPAPAVNPEGVETLPLAVRLRGEEGPPLPQMVAQRRAQISRENENYECLCVECRQPFIGHKRRVICKACSDLLTPSPQSTGAETPVNPSAPAGLGSLPSGESNPSVTLDYAGAETARLREALVLQEKAENAHMTCDECDPEDAPETCAKCFPLYDDARLARRAALAAVPADERGGEK